MRKIIFPILAILLMSVYIQTASAVTPYSEELKDSKPETPSIADQLYLRQDTIMIGMAQAKVLVNRLTNKVEYVFHNNYKRYIKPRFIMPDAQILYDATHGKNKPHQLLDKS